MKLNTLTLKAAALSFASFSLLAFTGCTAANEKKPNVQANSAKVNLLDYSLSNVLACLPDENSIVAAHRGTSRAWDIPENSLEGLTRLIDAGILIAEIDIAGLKDGQQIIFHDGVWERKTTGQGPVASSTSADREKILLKSFAGTLSAERPPLLSDVLKLSKDKIFLEIDFKSSAETDVVLRQIRENDMSDQVVLIAYTDERAKELHALAPEMLLSAPGEGRGKGLTPEKTLLWMGRDISSALAPTDNLGYIGMIGRDDAIAPKAKRAKFLVSDYPDQYDPILGPDNSDEIAACLKDKS